MKISFAVSSTPTAFCAIGQGNWKSLLNPMASLGYEGVELAVRQPAEIDVGQLQLLLEKYQLKLAAIGTGQAYVDEGLSLTDSEKSIRDSAVERLKKHIELGSIFGSPVIIGLIRGKLGKGRRETVSSYFKNSIAELADYACKKDVSLLIEPLNRYECDFFNRADEAVEFISETACPNIGILLDTFHMNIEEENISGTITRSRPFLKHIHIADSNRCYPGRGHLDFPAVISALKSVEYNGFLSGEILPLPDPAAAMKGCIKGIREVLNG